MPYGFDSRFSHQNKNEANFSPRFCFVTTSAKTRLCALHKLGSHFRPRRSLFTSASWAKIARLASLPEFNIQIIFNQAKRLGDFFTWCEKRTSNPSQSSALNGVRISDERRSFCSQGDGSAEIVHGVNLPVLRLYKISINTCKIQTLF